MNDKACSTCANYDVILKARKDETKRGWCVANSLYPHKEEQGQLFPVNAVRAPDPSTPAVPHIVQGANVYTTCVKYKAKPSSASKADLLRQLEEKHIK